MSNTIIYSDYNSFPGQEDTYDFGSGAQTPIFPDVTLYKSFNYTLKSTGVNSAPSPTQEDRPGGGRPGESSGSASGTGGGRPGERTAGNTGPTNGYVGVYIFKVPTEMRWVTDQGPDGDGACQNEKGDWFSEQVLGEPDRFGPGIKLETVPRSGSSALPFLQESAPEEGGTESVSVTVTAWNWLKISGAYNASVFPYNEFAFTTDYPTKENNYTTGQQEVDSLYEVPGKFNNLYKFIPDDREKTTLTFKVEVDWELVPVWSKGVGQYLSESTRTAILGKYATKGIGQTGTDTHTVTHVVYNDTSNWKALLEETLEKQYTTEEQWINGGQDFPFREFDLDVAASQVDTINDPVLNLITNATGGVVGSVTAGSDTIVVTTQSGVVNIGDEVIGRGIADGAVVEGIGRSKRGKQNFFGYVANDGFVSFEISSTELFATNGSHKLLDVTGEDSSSNVSGTDASPSGTDLNINQDQFVISENQKVMTVNAGTDNAQKYVKLHASVLSSDPKTVINLSIENTGSSQGRYLFRKKKG